MDLDHDPRWRRIHDRPWTCPTCKQLHKGLFDLACDKPDPWPGDVNDIQPNAAARTSKHFLSEDFCIRNGEDYFVRCVLEVPIIGSDQTFGYGVWSTLAGHNFDLYVQNFDKGDFENLGPWFGWFSNELKGYPDTLLLKCRVHPQKKRQRPRVEIQPTNHPLSHEQQDGITLDRLLEIYALNGHDIRRALMD